MFRPVLSNPWTDIEGWQMEDDPLWNNSPANNNGSRVDTVGGRLLFPLGCRHTYNLLAGCINAYNGQLYEWRNSLHVKYFFWDLFIDILQLEHGKLEELYEEGCCIVDNARTMPNIEMPNISPPTFPNAEPLPDAENIPSTDENPT